MLGCKVVLGEGNGHSFNIVVVCNGGGRGEENAAGIGGIGVDCGWEDGGLCVGGSGAAEVDCVGNGRHCLLAADISEQKSEIQSC